MKAIPSTLVADYFAKLAGGKIGEFILEQQKSLLELEKYREEEREMAEEVFRGGSGEFSRCDDGETLEDLSGKLSCYYRDLDLYDEKRITAEDGETLYHTMKYIFKQLKKAGVRFK